MSNEVKKRVDNKDIRGLQYVFADCLDVDPTFEKYKEDFEYCRKMLPEMFESHRELMPFLIIKLIGQMIIGTILRWIY